MDVQIPELGKRPQKLGDWPNEKVSTEAPVGCQAIVVIRDSPTYRYVRFSKLLRDSGMVPVILLLDRLLVSTYQLTQR